MKLEGKRSWFIVIWLCIVVALVQPLMACSPSPSKSESTSGQPPASSSGNSGKQITLKLADFFAPTTIQSVEGSQYFAKRIEDLSKGQIKIQYYPAEQLAKGPDLLKAVETRMADIADTAPTYQPTQLTLNTIWEVPYVFPDPLSGTKIMWTMLQGRLGDELKKYKAKPVGLKVLAPYDVWTNKLIKVPDDLKGMKIRAGGGYQTKVVAALGAVPVALTSPETYTSMERKVIDGAYLSIASVSGWRFYEVAKQGTRAKLGMSGGPYSMNLDAWNELSPDLQKAVMQAGLEAAENFARKVMQQEEEEEVKIKAAGVTIYVPTAQELELWKAKVSPLQEEWVKDRGADGQAVWDEYKKALAGLK